MQQLLARFHACSWADGLREKRRAKGTNSSGSQRSVAGVYVWDEGLFFCKFLGEVFLHKMKLHKKRSIVLQSVFIFHDVFFFGGFF